MQNFQGTSKEGDFQSALQDAINKALKALSFVDGAAISEQHIAWKIIEISGSRDALLGNKTIAVTIEALKKLKVNVKILARHWINSREEETAGNDVQIYRPENSRDFPPSRFRMQYVFDEDGKCQWYYLAPDDAHDFQDGTWQIDTKAENVIYIEQGEQTVSYRIVELTEAVLRIVLIT